MVALAPGSQLTWAGLSGGLSEEDWMDRRSLAEREGPVQTVVELHVRIDAQAVINGRGQVGGRRRTARRIGRVAVAGTVDDAALDAAAGQHGAENVRPVVAAVASRARPAHHAL